MEEGKTAGLEQWLPTAGTGPTRHSAMSGDIFGCHNWGHDTAIKCVEAGDTA